MKNRLQDDLKNAIRAGDDVKKSVLRMALTAIRLSEVDKGENLNDDEILGVLQKEVKARQEAIEDAEHADRPDLAEASEQEMEVLETYLPDQLTADELEGLAQQVIDEVGATSMREMGQVMKALMPRLGGRATGQQASEAVRKLLA